MVVNKVFKNLGDATTCGDLDFMASVGERLELFSHTPPQAIQARMINLFESNHRYEYTVRDDTGRLMALMVITADDLDYHTGKPCLVVEMACSLLPGLLTGAYRWVYDLAKHHGLEWVRFTRTENYTITMDYKQHDKKLKRWVEPKLL